MKYSVKGFKAVLLVGAAGALIYPAAVLAQSSEQADDSQPVSQNEETPAPAAEASSGANQIIVTGSRIARRDYSATSPIVTVDSALLEESAAINLEANLNKLPQFSPALTQFDTAEIQTNAPATLAAASTYRLGYLGYKRYVRLSLTKAGGTSIAAGAVAIRDPLTRPVA